MQAIRNAARSRNLEIIQLPRTTVRVNESLCTLDGQTWEGANAAFQANRHLKIAAIRQLGTTTVIGFIVYGKTNTPTYIVGRRNQVPSSIIGFKRTGNQNRIFRPSERNLIGEIVYVCGQHTDLLIAYVLQSFPRNVKAVLVNVPHGERNTALLAILVDALGFEKAVPMLDTNTELLRTNRTIQGVASFFSKNFLYMKDTTPFISREFRRSLGAFPEAFYRTSRCGKNVGNLTEAEWRRRIPDCFKDGFGVGYGIAARENNQ